MNIFGAQVLLAGKVFVGPGAITLGWLLVGGRLGVPRGLSGMLAFGLWGGVNGAVQGGNLLLGALFVSWSVCMFVMLPGIARSGLSGARYFKASLKVLIACALVVAWAIVNTGGSFIWEEGGAERVRYGFGMNPAYAAKIGVALVLAAAGCLVTAPSTGRWGLWIAALLGTGGVLLTDTRTMLSLLIVFVVAFWADVRRRMEILWVGLGSLGLWAGWQALSVGELPPENYEIANEYTSGRLGIWRMLLDHNFSHADAARLLIGNGDTQWPVAWMPTLRDAEGAAVSTFTTPHADSLYVDVLCAHGILGLGLLVYGLVSWWRELGRSRSFQSCWARAALLAIAVAGVSDTIFPSFGNMINATVLVGCVLVSSGSGIVRAGVLVRRGAVLCVAR